MAFRDRVGSNLESGSLNFAIVAREIPETLRGSIDYLSTVANLRIFGVEVDYFRSEGTEIFIPRCINSKPQPVTYQRTNEEECIERYDDLGKRVYGRMLEWARMHGYRTKWGTKAFGLRVPYKDGDFVLFTGYPSESGAEQRLYITFTYLVEKGIPVEFVDDFRKKFLEISNTHETKTALVLRIEPGFEENEVEMFLEVIDAFIARIAES